MSPENPLTKDANIIIHREISNLVDNGDLINASLQFALSYAELPIELIDDLTEKFVIKATDIGTDSNLALARTVIEARLLLGVAQKQNETIIGQKIRNPSEIE